MTKWVTVEFKVEDCHRSDVEVGGCQGARDHLSKMAPFTVWAPDGHREEFQEKLPVPSQEAKGYRPIRHPQRL